MPKKQTVWLTAFILLLLFWIAFGTFIMCLLLSGRLSSSLLVITLSGLFVYILVLEWLTKKAEKSRRG